MKRLLMLAVGVALTAAACGTSASDSDVSLNPSAGGATDGASAKPQTSAAKTTPASPVYREVTILAGTSLPLRLTTAVASDTSRVEDPISAELTDPVTIDGHEMLPAARRSQASSRRPMAPVASRGGLRLRFSLPR